jgi:alkylated DNA nucleotide flippase Atl1
MTYEIPQSNEQPFNKDEVLEKINSIIDQLEDGQIAAFGEVPEDIAFFINK